MFVCTADPDAAFSLLHGDGREAFVAAFGKLKWRWLCLLGLWLAGLSIARADSTAHIVEAHPSVSAALGRNEYFWVRIEYATDEQIRLWVRPYRNGSAVKSAISNPSLTYTGSGEALGWFALSEPGEVDEVRIIAGGGTPYSESELSRLPVQLTWITAATAAPRPQWVEDLLAMEQSHREEDARRRAAEPTTARDVTLFNGFMLFMLALIIVGIGAPLWSMWKWRGGWRMAAALPAAAMAFVVLRIVVDTARDPTSHNLWPFEIAMYCVIAVVWIGALRVARRFMGV